MPTGAAEIGDGHITVGRRNVHCLSIFCVDAWPGVRAEVQAAPSAVLPASKVSSVQRIGCAAVKSYKSLDILALCDASLDRLGIAYRRPRWDQVSVARREAVAALDAWVGPKT